MQRVIRVITSLHVCLYVCNQSIYVSVYVFINVLGRFLIFYENPDCRQSCIRCIVGELSVFPSSIPSQIDPLLLIKLANQ